MKKIKLDTVQVVGGVAYGRGEVEVSEEIAARLQHSSEPVPVQEGDINDLEPANKSESPADKKRGGK